MLTMYSLTYFSTEISFEIVAIGEIIYFEKWYIYPKSLQIFVLLWIQSTQNVQYLTGLEVVYCNLETFLKVNGN